MKSYLYNVVKFLPVLMMAFTFSSCEEVYLDVNLDGESSHVSHSTDYLCSRVWVDEWYDDNGVYYCQELSFYPNRTGSEYMYTEDTWGYVQRSSYSFVWDWKNSRCDNIRLKYGPSDFSYMEHIKMGGNKLDCYFDGQPAYFEGK